MISSSSYQFLLLSLEPCGVDIITSHITVLYSVLALLIRTKPREEDIAWLAQPVPSLCRDSLLLAKFQYPNFRLWLRFCGSSSTTAPTWTRFDI